MRDMIAGIRLALTSEVVYCTTIRILPPLWASWNAFLQ